MLVRFCSVANTVWARNIYRLFQLNFVETRKELLWRQEGIIGDREVHGSISNLYTPFRLIDPKLPNSSC